MKKILYLLMISAMLFSIGGCSENNGVSVTEDESRTDSQAYIIQKNQNKTGLSPNDSISFEKACEFLDK